MLAEEEPAAGRNARPGQCTHFTRALEAVSNSGTGLKTGRKL